MFQTFFLNFPVQNFWIYIFGQTQSKRPSLVFTHNRRNWENIDKYYLILAKEKIGQLSLPVFSSDNEKFEKRGNPKYP